jgi:hypothetical protein
LKELSKKYKKEGIKIEIIILEGKKISGGRTITKLFGKNQIPIDLGASWLQGKEVFGVYNIFEKHNFNFSKDYSKNVIYDSNSKKLSRKCKNGKIIHKIYQ